MTDELTPRAVERLLEVSEPLLERPELSGVDAERYRALLDTEDGRSWCRDSLDEHRPDVGEVLRRAGHVAASLGRGRILIAGG